MAMKKSLVLVILALAGCPASTTPASNGFKYRCPDPNTDCTASNGQRATGVVVHDAPARVTSIQLPGGQTIRAK
jgi:hypothetical protein